MKKTIITLTSVIAISGISSAATINWLQMDISDPNYGLGKTFALAGYGTATITSVTNLATNGLTGYNGNGTDNVSFADTNTGDVQGFLGRAGEDTNFSFTLTFNNGPLNNAFIWGTDFFGGASLSQKTRLDTGGISLTKVGNVGANADLTNAGSIILGSGVNSAENSNFGLFEVNQNLTSITFGVDKNSSGDGIGFGIGYAPVPEPSSTVLLGLGGLALLLRRRK